ETMTRQPLQSLERQVLEPRQLVRQAQVREKAATQARHPREKMERLRHQLLERQQMTTAQVQDCRSQVVAQGLQDRIGMVRWLADSSAQRSSQRRAPCQSQRSALLKDRDRVSTV